MTASPAFNPRQLLAEARLGVLATIKSDGMPQLSPITPYYDPEADTILIVVSEDRAKTRNMRRRPRAALQVTRADGWAWATAEGEVTLTEPTTDLRSREAQALLHVYRRTGRQADQPQDLQAMIVDERLVLTTLKITKIYGERLADRYPQHGDASG